MLSPRLFLLALLLCGAFFGSESGFLNAQEPAAHEVAFKLSANGNLQVDLDSIGENIIPSEEAKLSFGPFITSAVIFGFVTLLTPCVFPMIPITVSFFIKQGEKKKAHPLLLASVYTLTIVLVLGVAAVTLLKRFQDLATNPWTNVALGVLFVFFAFSLFGMFDLVLPSFMVRATSSQESRGGYLGTIFMALSFTIVSFTCVAPFMGTFAGLASSDKISKSQLYLGGLAFAGTFAAPFFVLALFPSLLKKLPRSGAWMNTVKVFMGFLEVAAAVKFFRTAEVLWFSPPTLFTYDLVLGLWVALALASGLYLLGVYRLPHDVPYGHIGVVRLLFALGSISMAIYLAPGLLPNGKHRHRPDGVVYAWVDAFLLPDAEDVGSVISGDLRRALEEARKTDKLVFVDFTGVSCTNCRLNEKGVFPKKEVSDLMKQYFQVQMYTDSVPEGLYDGRVSEERREADADKIKAFQAKIFGTSQLPLYVILKPLKNGKIQVIGPYPEGKINDVKGFIEFLKKPLEK